MSVKLFNTTKLLLLFLFSACTVSVKGQEFIPDSTHSMSGKISEIVIKASKDNVTYRTIPASVSVINSKEIAENEIGSLNDLTATAPNFFMPEYGSKLTSPVYIRGIGSRINSPSVGLYVDYVPYFEKASFNFDFFDIRRIEVLRGPQGTLFGRNTMGGIVNIVTTSPMDYQGSHINLSAGNFGSYSFNGGHYGKLGERIGYSAAVNLLHNDGFYTNIYNATKADRLNSTGFRNRLIFEITDKITAENIASFELSRQGGYPYAVFIDSINAPGEINYNQYSSYDRDIFSNALLLRYSGRSFEILSTTSFQYLGDKQKIDQDFTPDSLYFVVQDQLQNMISQEVIFRSAGLSGYKWLAGIYGFYQGFNNSVNVDAYAQKMSYLKKYDHRIAGAALFHQSSIENFLLRNLTVTAGVRLDIEKDMLDFHYDRTLRGTFAVLEDTIYPALKSVQVLPRFAVNYRLGSFNFYSVAARGYKTGGFNQTFERPEDLTFDPEYSWNYEAGIKSAFLDNNLNIDMAVFYIDWKNQQIYQTVPSGRGSMLKNAGHSMSRGAELSVRAADIMGFDIMLSYGFTDARFITYELNPATRYDDNRLPYVPLNTLSLQLAKSLEIKNSRILDRVRIISLYRGLGDIYWNEENTAKQNFYSLVDLKISFQRKMIQAEVWTKNLLNSDYSSFWFEALGNKYVQTGKPLQAGMNLSIRF